MVTVSIGGVGVGGGGGGGGRSRLGLRLFPISVISTDTLLWATQLFSLLVLIFTIMKTATFVSALFCNFCYIHRKTAYNKQYKEDHVFTRYRREIGM